MSLPDRLEQVVKKPPVLTVAEIGTISQTLAGVFTDLFKLSAQRILWDKAKEAIPSICNYPMIISYKAQELEKGGKLSELPLKVLTDINDIYEFLIEAYWVGNLNGMGGAYASYLEQFYNPKPLLHAVNSLQWESSLIPRMRRYWSREYTPSLPDERMAFRMLMEGQLSRSQFNDALLNEGWATEWHDKIYEVFNRDPDERMAFSMFKRGLITEAKMKQCFRIRGFDAGYDPVLYQVLHRKPTFRELMTLADYVPLPTLWVTEVLRAIGYLDTDINYIAPAIELRPLREEIRSVVGRYLWEYQIGRITRDDLKKNLTALRLQPKEIELNMLWGDLRFADELIDESLAIIEERCKQKNITTKAEALIEIKKYIVREEKANLVAELWAWKYGLT